MICLKAVLCFGWGVNIFVPNDVWGRVQSAPQRVYSWTPRSRFQLKKKKVSLVHWAGSCTALTSGALSVPGCPRRTQECVSGAAPESSVHYTHPHIRTHETIARHTHIDTLTCATWWNWNCAHNICHFKHSDRTCACATHAAHANTHTPSFHTSARTYVTPNSSENRCN